ncbi:MAG: hypothetical protein ACTHOJ_15635 [Sphingomonas oligoaromativorans]
MAIDIPATITACGGALTTIGGACAWIWRKIEHRFREIESKLAECKEQHQHAHSLAEKLWTCVQIMVQELEAHGSSSPALAIVRRILRDAYLVNPVPGDMAETLERVV